MKTCSDNKNSITLLQGINQFLNEMKILKGSPESTIEAYDSDLKLFRDFITQKYPGVRNIEQIKLLHLTAFKKYLQDEYTFKVGDQSKSYNHSSIQRKINCLKAFFKSMAENQYIERNIAFTIPSRAKDKAQRRQAFKDFIQNVLSDEEIHKLIETAKNTGGKFSIRNSAIVTFIANTGCRRSEALKATWGDVNFKEHSITLYRDKSANYDMIPMQETLEKALLELWQHTCPRIDDPIFQSRHQTPLSPSTFNAIFKNCVANAELKRNFDITPHTIRHSVLTKLAQKGFTERDLQIVSGHRDSRSLDPYLHFSMNHKRKIFSEI